MLRSVLLLVASLSLPVLAAGCAATQDVAEEEGETNSALTGNAEVGAQYEITTAVNFRVGPAKKEPRIRLLEVPTIVTIVDATPQNNYYNVEVDGETGWAQLGSAKRVVEGGDDDAPTTETETETERTGTGNIETCKASFYASGQKTANGEKFNTNDLTAAHKTLKFNTMVRVTNTATGASVDVRINDRGPFIEGRCIDLSRAAFGTIAPLGQGVASVTVETLN